MRLHLNLDGVALCCVLFLRVSGFVQQGDQAEDPIMVVLPADHIIKEREAFQAALKQAIEAAKQGGLVTFGIKPTRPDSGFGYIQVDGQFADHQSPLKVIKFTEKPDQTSPTISKKG